MDNSNRPIQRPRAQVGQPPGGVPGALEWQTVWAQRGDVPPARCPACGQLVVGTGVIPRTGAPPPVLSGAQAAGGTAPSQALPGAWSGVWRPPDVVRWPLGTWWGSQRAGDTPA